MQISIYATKQKKIYIYANRTTSRVQLPQGHQGRRGVRQGRGDQRAVEPLERRRQVQVARGHTQQSEALPQEILSREQASPQPQQQQH